MIAQATLKDIEADTVVAEFKTDKNKLSVWKIENDNDLQDAFIALGSNCANIGTIWAAKISPEDLEEVAFDDEEGNTPTIGINQKHRNIIDLNYVSLGSVISSIIGCFQKDNMVIKKTRAEMRKLLAEAYASNRLQAEALTPNVLDEIVKEVAKTTPRG